MNIYKFVIPLALVIAVFAQAKSIEPPAPVDNRPALIDAYFESRGMPLAGYGQVFVRVADTYGIDWRLLPAISVREQSGGKVLPYNCPNRTKNYNAFGWGSGSICFTSFEVAIETVGMKLGTHRYYAGKTTFAKLQTYNPPSVVPTYAQEVIAIMKIVAPDEQHLTEK